MDDQQNRCSRLEVLLGIADFRPPSAMDAYSLIGQGTTGIGVFKAKAKSNGQKYAVKKFRFRREFLAAAEKGEMLSYNTVVNSIQEFKNIRDFRHLNLVKYLWVYVLFDRKPQEHHLCVVMERCYGPTLDADLRKHYARRSTGYAEAEIRRHFTSVALGLHYLHEQRIVHRDLRPENLIFAETTKQTLKVTDYSTVVKLQESVTMTNEVAGGAGPPWTFKAPELVDAVKFGQAGRRSDVWSLGCILVLMLQGTPPIFRYNAGRKVISAVSPDEVRTALSQGVVPLMDGDFGRRPRYGVETRFLNSAKAVLKKCLVPHKDQRPYMNSVRDYEFFNYVAP
ncbi:cell division protein kinase 2 homolog CRK1-like [Paramacrobiotus metropolitanus]|uniref:cell division protein kinase 2 homolog CRK1-like n=1 Tax=Paramacrobiotus metropolitanus TaxID=2943436 RepID=UPI0024460AE6|nr:cell division protein kinase 2 homolog CRK1-like [Paramacrobiotus metropolitanus]